MRVLAKFHPGRSLSLLLLVSLPVISLAGGSASPPLGTVVTSERVIISGQPAPTGTTLFSGDRLKVGNAPALVRFNSGGRIQMISAAATFRQDGDFLIIEPEYGLLLFNFGAKDNVRIVSGGREFTLRPQSAPCLGSLALNRNGQIALGLVKGEFDLRMADGGRRTISSSTPLVVLNESGNAWLSRGGNKLVDESKSWNADELEGMSVRVGGETHEIIGNSGDCIYLDGKWSQSSGNYEYEIHFDTAARVPVVIPVGEARAAVIPGLPAATVSTIAPDVPAATGAGIGFRLLDKTDSSRSSP